MTALLEGLEGCSVLLQATSEGRGLYERLGFVRTGEIRQHQGVAQPAPLIALGPSGACVRPPRPTWRRCARWTLRRAACRGRR